MEQRINRDHMIYKTGDKKKDKKYDFQKCKTIRFLKEKFMKMNLH